MTQRGFWNWIAFSTIAIILIVFALFAGQQIPEDTPTPPDWEMVGSIEGADIMFLDGLYYIVSKDEARVCVERSTSEEVKKLLLRGSYE